MANIIQNFFIQKKLSLFSTQKKIQYLQEDFNKTPLGKIHLSVPWSRLVRMLKKKPTTKGKKSLFSIKGEFALMILKSYTNLSDRKLAEQINSNIQYQIFCDLPISIKPLIKNFKIISRIRVELSKKIDWDKFQEYHIEYWKDYLEEKSQILIDATCYETDLRYPTDVKLLNESLEYILKRVKAIHKLLKLKNIRSKYKEVKREYIIYSRLRKKSYKKTKKMIKKLLYLNKKYMLHLECLQKDYGLAESKKQKIIKEIIYQQELKHQGEKVTAPILSIHKPYIRPIVRGKETKRVEFGCKVNKIQINKINIIEEVSYKNFNEGKRNKASIEKSEKLTGTKVKITGADAIYATNANRVYAKSRKIQTDFKRKGRAGKEEQSRKQLSSIIRKARGSKLEGSFGVEKRHYGLEKIKMRTEETEILSIYIGIYTKNMLEIGRRIYKSSSKENIKQTG